jgi:hypothetical protein
MIDFASYVKREDSSVNTAGKTYIPRPIIGKDE